jgi:chemotaxis protein MotA
MERNYGAVYGLLLGVISIFGAYLLEGGSLFALFLIPPMIVVFGGTFAAVLISFGSEKFKKIFLLIKLAYFPKNYDIQKIINVMVQIAAKGRIEGLLSIEKDIHKLEYGFPQRMLRFVLDGTDPESLENIAYSGMKAMQDRHYSYMAIFQKMGGYAPTMGILGTVMGLIMTLANAGNNPDMLIHSIASAFIATLWGVFSANVFWLPIADKLKQCHLEEKHMMEVTLEGVLALQSGEIPSVIRSRLISMLPENDQKEYLKR